MIRKLKERLIKSETVYDGKFLQVKKDTVSLPDKTIGIREYFRHPGAVVIIPLFNDGKVLLEKQFRYPLNKVFIEFPAGKIDSGEDSLSTAKRELFEETGYSANKWKYLSSIHNAIAYSDERIDIYLAEDLKKGKRKLEKGEFINLFRVTFLDLMKFIDTGKITDVKTIVCAFKLLSLKNNNFNSFNINK